MRLIQKTAIVTGAASGNGRAIAYGFAKEGASVVIFDIDEHGANNTASNIKEKGGSSLAITGDISDNHDVDRAIRKTLENYPKIDVLVNNAGIFTKAHFLDFNEADFDRTIRINLKGAFVFSQRAAFEMKKSGSGGSIINISSINGAGESVRPMGAAYASSKGGLKSLTKVMAIDLAKYQIRVNSIAPGYFKTPMTKTLLSDDAYLKLIVERIPLGYIGDPEQLVGPAVFLASDDSSYVTGAVIPVDGGWWCL